VARILLFGALSDLAGWREKSFEVKSVSDLRRQLGAEDAALVEALDGPGVQVAVDQVIVRHDAALTTTSEVAFLPPMSGG